MHGCRLVAAGGQVRVALPVKALKAGQEAYWLDQIARNREAYFSGRGESPGRFVGSAAQASGLDDVASAEQVRAMFQGLDPATGKQRCAPLWRADPRSKLTAGPLLDALTAYAAQQGIEDLEDLARSKALKGDVRSVQAACRAGGTRRVKVETVERLCRKVLGTDPRELYGDGFERAWQHRGTRVNERVQSFDHCFSSPKSVSLLAAGSGDHIRRQMAEARDEALQVGIAYLERHGIGVRRDHNGTDRHQALGGVVGVAFEHRMSRAGDPQFHTHILVQNAAQGPDGRWTALDSDIKDRPKTDASVREVPLPRQVAEAIARQLPPAGEPAALVFTGPGGGFRRRRGERTALSRNNFRRVYQRAVASAAAMDGSALASLRLRGPHDLRHTYAT
jgi:hypothetical protein